MRVSVVVPAYGSWELTRRCLETLEAERRAGAVGEIVVVDDGSTDGSRDRIAADPRVRAVLLPENGGFGRAANAGARVAGGDAVLILNNDTLVRPGAIRALARALDDPGVGIVGPKLIYDDGTLQSAGLGFREGRDEAWFLHGHLDPELDDANVARDFAVLVGAAFLVRRPLWDDLGGFDERYRNGCEDLDLCLRAWSRGARVRYEPAAEIVHLEGASRGRTVDDGENRRQFAATWGPALRRVPRVSVPESPTAAIVVERRATGLEALAFGSFVAALRRDFGGRVTVVRSKADLVRAHALAALDRRGLLEIAWRPLRTRADVAIAAPADDREAAIAARAGADAFWTPSAPARDRLIAAGVEPERVAVVPIGVAEDAYAPGDRARPAIATYVERADDPHVPGLLALASRAEDLRLEVLVDERYAPALRAALPRNVAVVALDDTGSTLRGALARARVFLAPPEAEPYDLLLGAARTAGCVVVAAPARAAAAGLDPAIAVVAGPGDLAEAAVRAATGGDDERSALTRRDAARRHRATQGAYRARELSRVLEHGLLDGDRLAVDARTAAALRG